MKKTFVRGERIFGGRCSRVPLSHFSKSERCIFQVWKYHMAHTHTHFFCANSALAYKYFSRHMLGRNLVGGGPFFFSLLFCSLLFDLLLLLRRKTTIYFGNRSAAQQDLEIFFVGPYEAAKSAVLLSNPNIFVCETNSKVRSLRYKRDSLCWM